MPKTIRTKAVGVTKGNRQEVIQFLYPDALLDLRREPDNPYDENAIRIYDGDYSDDDIGYLSRELAAEIAPIMDKNRQLVTAEVIEVTGQDKGTQGVNILITIYSEEETEEISRKVKEKNSAPKPAPMIQPVISIPQEPTFATPEDSKEVISKKIINASLNSANKFIKKKRTLKQWFLLLLAISFAFCFLASIFNVFLESVGILPTRPPTLTDTPEPTATAEPTSASLIFSSTITPQDVIDAFKAAGLEAENVRAMTKDDYGIAPMASEGLRFYIPSLGADEGGRVMYYEDPVILQAAKTYYEELGKSSSIFFSWVFVNGNILVQINGDLPEEQALRYQSALMDVK